MPAWAGPVVGCVRVGAGFDDTPRALILLPRMHRRERGATT
jgi:hypothetical protein